MERHQGHVGTRTGLLLAGFAVIGLVGAMHFVAASRDMLATGPTIRDEGPDTVTGDTARNRGAGAMNDRSPRGTSPIASAAPDPSNSEERIFGDLRLGMAVSAAEKVLVEQRAFQHLRSDTISYPGVELRTYLEPELAGDAAWWRLHFFEDQLFLAQVLLTNPQQSADVVVAQIEKLLAGLLHRYGSASHAIGRLTAETVAAPDDVARIWRFRTAEGGLASQLTLESSRGGGGYGFAPHWPVTHITWVDVARLRKAERAVASHAKREPPPQQYPDTGWRVTQRLPVAAINNPYSVRLFLIQLQEAVRQGDDQALVNMIHLPIVRHEKDQRIEQYEDRQQLAAAFDAFFTPQVRQAIRDQRYESLFVNYLGVMIGRGEIWLGRGTNGLHIIAVNGEQIRLTTRTVTFDIE